MSGSSAPDDATRPARPLGFIIGAAITILIIAIVIGLKFRQDRRADRQPAQATEPGGGPGNGESADQPAPGSVAAQLDEGHRELVEAARACLPAGPPAPAPADAGIRFRYLLTAEKGEARVEGFAVLETSIPDPKLAACLEEKLRGARWPTSFPEAQESVAEEIKLGELSR